MSEGKRRLFQNTRRETLIVLGVSFVAIIWVVGGCYLHGYQHDPDSWLVRNGLITPRTPENLTTIFGFPDWVFWGIAVPWGICTLFTLFFGFSIMSDDELSEPAKGDATDGH